MHWETILAFVGVMNPANVPMSYPAAERDFALRNPRLVDEFLDGDNFAAHAVDGLVDNTPAAAPNFLLPDVLLH